MKKIISILTILIASIFLTACEDEPKTPSEVTQAFWMALETKNMGQLKHFISEQSLREEYTAEDIVSVSKARFGKILIDGRIAEVETTVTVESDQPEEVSLNTQLVKENEKWKVDYQATIDEINSTGKLSQVIRELRVLGEQFSKDLSKEFESSMNELDKTMPEIENNIKHLGEQIKEHVPELRQQFEDLAEQLEQALEESLSSDEGKKKSI